MFSLAGLISYDSEKRLLLALASVGSRFFNDLQDSLTGTIIQLRPCLGNDPQAGINLVCTRRNRLHIEPQQIAGRGGLQHGAGRRLDAFTDRVHIQMGVNLVVFIFYNLSDFLEKPLPSRYDNYDLFSAF